MRDHDPGELLVEHPLRDRASLCARPDCARPERDIAFGPDALTGPAAPVGVRTSDASDARAAGGAPLERKPERALPFIVGFSEHTTALVFYLIVGAGGLAATLATRFEPRVAAEREMAVRMAA